MNNKTEGITNNTSPLENIIGWVFGAAVLAAGIINMFWGNDAGFGVFLALLSFIYFPPANIFIEKRFGFSIHFIVKIIVGIFIIWASLGVGELFDKIDLMMGNLQSN